MSPISKEIGLIVWNHLRSKGESPEFSPTCKTYSIGIANFIDLNQDGVLEVVVDIQRWEGSGAAVYQVEDRTVTQVLKAGCGL